MKDRAYLKEKTDYDTKIHCLVPTPTENKRWKVRVLTVETQETPMLHNWINSLTDQGYEYEILGYGEKWQGWKWKTQKYIQRLAEESEEIIFVICDSSNTLFLQPPMDLMLAFKTYRADLVLGAEEKHGFSERALKIINKRNAKTRYKIPNSNFMIGFRTAVLDLLCSNLNEDEIFFNWLNSPDSENTNKMDIYVKMNLSLKENDLELLELSENEGKKVKQLETNAYPCSISFPNHHKHYNHFAKLILGERAKKMDKTFLEKIFQHNWKQ
jgi:hypothetical protein